MYLPQKLPDFNVGKTVKIFCLTFSLLGFDRTQLAACFSRSETGTVKSTDPTLKIGRTGEQFSSTGCVLSISQWTTCEIITSSIKIIANWCFARGFSSLGKLNISQGMHTTLGSARKAPNQFTRSPDDSLFQFPLQEEEKKPKNRQQTKRAKQHPSTTAKTYEYSTRPIRCSTGERTIKNYYFLRSSQVSRFLDAGTCPEFQNARAFTF